jgi:hypothetical protein
VELPAVATELEALDMVEGREKINHILVILVGQDIAPYRWTIVGFDLQLFKTKLSAFIGLYRYSLAQDVREIAKSEALETRKEAQ